MRHSLPAEAVYGVTDPDVTGLPGFAWRYDGKRPSRHPPASVGMSCQTRPHGRLPVMDAAAEGREGGVPGAGGLRGGPAGGVGGSRGPDPQRTESDLRTAAQRG